MIFFRCKKIIRQTAARVLPPEDWKKSAREALLAEIRRSPVWREARLELGKQLKNFDFLRILPPWHIVFKPVGIAAMIVVIVFSGFGATVSAARGALPGDVFYPMKISLEKAQISLALSLEKKAELEIAFAGTRLKEAQAMVDKGKPREANVNEAITHLSQGLDSVQKRLDQIKKSPDARQAAGMARLVNDNALVMEENLLQLKGRLSLATIDQALVKLDETNSKSLAVMVEKALVLPDSQVKEEAAAKLQTTIERMEKKIEVTAKKIDSVNQVVINKDNDLTASSVSALISGRGQASTTPEIISPEILKQVVKEVASKPGEAKKTIEDAKKLLEENDTSKLGDVLNKVQETNSIVQDAREKLKNAEVLHKTR